MKVLITGSNGQLGYDVRKELENHGVENKGFDVHNVNITDEAAVIKYITDYNPDYVIHCAAYTNVEKAEEEYEKCYAVNADGTKYVAEACLKSDAKMIYISTDYVFDGYASKPYDIEDIPNPLSVYGKSKLMGENHVKTILDQYYIVRTSWAFGENGDNFVKKILHLAGDHDSVRVVCDQIGSPTYTADLAQLLYNMMISKKYGVYHMTNEGYCSWSEFAKTIMNIAGLKCKIIDVPADAYPAKAIRPQNSRLSKKSLEKAGFERLRSWETALDAFMKTDLIKKLYKL